MRQILTGTVILVALGASMASAEDRPPTFLGFTLGCEKVVAEQVAAASKRMTRKPAPRTDRSTEWVTVLYAGNNVFRNALTTTLVFRDRRLYSIAIRFPEVASRPPLELFHAIRNALVKKYGPFDKPEPLTGKNTISRLADKQAERLRIYVEVVSLGGTHVEVRAFHKASRDRIIGEEQKVVQDDPIDIEGF